MAKLEALLNRLSKRDDIVFICGDFNIDITCKKDRKGKLRKNRFLKLLDLWNLQATILKPTRQTGPSATTIDNIITSLKTGRYEAFNVDPGLSDHSCQVIKAKISCRTIKERNQPRHLLKRAHTDENIKQFKEQLDSIDWETILEPGLPIDELYNKFVEIVKNCYNIACLKKHKVRNGSKTGTRS